MRTSLFVLVAVAIALQLTACAARKPQKPPSPPKPLYAAHTATLDVTYGINVIGVASIPSEFVPDMSHAPMWLREGSEIGILGSTDGKMAVMGFSGPQLSNRRVLAEDFGADAAGGRILDAAASPDGREIAIAVTEPTQDRLDLILNDDVNPGEGHTVASIDGNFASAQISWLDASTIALITGVPLTGAERAAGDSGTAVPESGLHMITVGPQASARYLDRIGCPLSHLVFSSNRYFAIGEGDSSAPPVIVDVHDQTCRAIRLRAPIKVLAWAPDSTAFLYSTEEGPGKGVFRFDLTTGKIATVAISSGTAAYASDGTIIALGNGTLSWKRIAEEPDIKVKAEIALLDPHQPEIRINSLGFETTPTMLARSTMVFATVSGNGVIDISIPGIAEPLRELIEYSYPARAAFVLAAGPAQGAVSMSWSPDGKLIAFIDGNSQLKTLAVVAPPK